MSPPDPDNPRRSDANWYPPPSDPMMDGQRMNFPSVWDENMSRKSWNSGNGMSRVNWFQKMEDPPISSPQNRRPRPGSIPAYFASISWNSNHNPSFKPTSTMPAGTKPSSPMPSTITEKTGFP